MKAPSFWFIATTLSGVAGLPGDQNHPHHGEERGEGDSSLAIGEVWHGKVTIVESYTVQSTTTIPTTCYVEVTDYVYINSTVTHKFTENSTTTLHHTVELTDTEFETETEKETVTETDTDSVTVTTTGTVPATITTYTTETETLLKTTYDPCPKSCSIDAATVTLFYWPTDRAHSYPSTYVDDDLDYTFVSPSVYMLIPSAKGTNSKGQHVGPSTTNWILGLDLNEVSTIADGPSGSLTRQLELSDLGTDCPQSMDPTAIATLSDSRCAPILAAPTTVSSWAYPCNACGRFGLFDPPYAVPTITGLIEPTTTETIPTTSAEPTGTIFIIYHEDGEPKSTQTLETVGMSGESTSSVALSVKETEPSLSVPEMTKTDENPIPPMIAPTGLPSTVPTPSGPNEITASAHKAASGGAVFAAIAISLSATFLNL